MKPIQSIKAIQYRAYGAYAENRFVDLPAPAANDGQVLVRMRTVGINPLDNTFRSGHHYAATPENLPRVGGQMGVGVVVETKSPGFKVGDRVFVTGPGFGVIADGVWRELIAAPAAGPRISTMITLLPSSPVRAIWWVSCADGVCCLQTSPKRACSRYWWRGGYGECADCA
jgi:NADPH:quinone reductase-like Zn-dependent oxidoreductase